MFIKYHQFIKITQQESYGSSLELTMASVHAYYPATPIDRACSSVQNYTDLQLTHAEGRTELEHHHFATMDIDKGKKSPLKSSGEKLIGTIKGRIRLTPEASGRQPHSSAPRVMRSEAHSSTSAQITELETQAPGANCPFTGKIGIEQLSKWHHDENKIQNVVNSIEHNDSDFSKVRKSVVVVPLIESKRSLTSLLRGREREAAPQPVCSAPAVAAAAAAAAGEA